jgi:hypothetical protein
LCVETNGYHRDIGTPESLRRACVEFGQLVDKSEAIAGRSF